MDRPHCLHLYQWETTPEGEERDTRVRKEGGERERELGGRSQEEEEREGRGNFKRKQREREESINKR